MLLLKTELLGKKSLSSEIGWSSNKNKNVKRTLMWLLRVYKFLGFDYKSSSTIREVISDILTKLPSQEENLNFIKNSLENNIYGGSEITSNDFNYYSKWNSFAKSHTKTR